MNFDASEIVSKEGDVTISNAGNLELTFQYQSGNHRLNIVGVDLLNSNNEIVASDYHIGFTGGASANNSYNIDVPAAGDYTIRYFVEINTESVNSTGSISFVGATVKAIGVNDEITLIDDSNEDPFTEITGRWSRNTTLRSNETFKVSTVIGVVAEGQQRRFFLAYHERERVVPWRSFVHYNSWYELNINRNNDSNPMNRMTEQQCLPEIEAWKTKLYDVYDVGIDAFVWDDGWDDFNSLWDFHVGFPNGFQALDQKVAEQGAGTGTWLGPVGGYGSSKAQRLSYWNKTFGQNISNFELSNQTYFDAFVNRCSQMVDDYDMRYFKFDGISDFFSATGPKSEEDAEGFINLVNALREKRDDLYINATVGTWASPFWFQIADAVWRHENDFDQVGNQGNAREKWITYRDRLVHQNFVTNSPLCPINSLMTHGLIVTRHGPPAAMPYNNSAATYKGIVKEMRMAFGSGSSLVELYLDNDLMTSIGNGRLWGDLAESIKWHRKNEDLLADIHWIGGNPWDGSEANIYGFAAWNGDNSVITLRNPSGTAKTLTTTLRDLLDIPAYVSGEIKLTDAFSSQTNYEGITDNVIDIDAEISFNMPAFDVVVFDGIDNELSTSVESPNRVIDNSHVYGEIRKIVFKNLGKDAKIRVVDMSGKIVANFTSESSDCMVDVPLNGVYAVSVQYKDGSRKSSKVIVF